MRRIVGGTGELLMTLGVVVALFLVYQLWFTSLSTNRAQAELRTEITQALAEPATEPVAATKGSKSKLAPKVKQKAPSQGHAFALLRIPRLGADYEQVVVEGTSSGQLAKGPGHISGTALPGEVGNMVISGHRVTHSQPFYHLDSVGVGDPIIVENRAGTFTYKVTETRVVSPSDVWVTLPVPGRADTKATESLLTLTTCNPRYSARTRLVVFATLEN